MRLNLGQEAEVKRKMQREKNQDHNSRGLKREKEKQQRSFSEIRKWLGQKSKVKIMM